MSSRTLCPLNRLVDYYLVKSFESNNLWMEFSHTGPPNRVPNGCSLRHQQPFHRLGAAVCTSAYSKRARCRVSVAHGPRCGFCPLRWSSLQWLFMHALFKSSQGGRSLTQCLIKTLHLHSGGVLQMSADMPLIQPPSSSNWRIIPSPSGISHFHSQQQGI